MTDEDVTDDTSITEHPPDKDIDDYVEDCNFRIERMGDSHIWVCAYTHDSSEADHHFDISIRDGGLHVTHRRENPVNTEETSEREPDSDVRMLPDPHEVILPEEARERIENLASNLSDKDDLTDFEEGVARGYMTALAVLGDDRFDVRPDLEDSFEAKLDDLDDEEKARVYRRWRRADVSDSEAKEFFGEEWEKVKRMARNDEIVADTPDPDDDDDDLFFEEQQDEGESGVVPVAAKDAAHIASLLREVDGNGEAEFYAEYLEEHAEEHSLPSHIDGEPVEAVIEELADRRELLDMMSETPTNEPSDDLIDEE